MTKTSNFKTIYEIREVFLNFFEEKGHKIVDSAPLVIKNDPSLMFINAGMNPFKDFFLGNKQSDSNQIANAQTCLRVSGKHNDLEEVGQDHYHHTLFEMLGNWSFGNYFKIEAIDWAWELLTEVYKIDKDLLYVTVFGGDKKDGLEADYEAEKLWLKHLPKERILHCDRTDNFWEMGETGPCGPCSEIHIDLRNTEDRAKLDGAKLVNEDHEEVIELWNLVFIQYNRKADKSLVNLPKKHIDTGMGLERLARVLQHKKSNYDVDIFASLIQKMENISGIKYGTSAEKDVAFRVIADHIRAITFAIADGQLPSNTGAGYVIRRILRRAVRFAYSSMGIEDAFIYKLIPTLALEMGTFYSRVRAQEKFISKVVKEEENSFLKTLSKGLSLLQKNIVKLNGKELSGKVAFELYDTYGFPFDLTELVAKEKGLTVNESEFKAKLNIQKQRSKKDAAKTEGDWIALIDDKNEEFIGYDFLETEVKIARYREVTIKDKKYHQAIFNLTPFYPEGGGQIGDNGTLTSKKGKAYKVVKTYKENDTIVHQFTDFPLDTLNDTFIAKVNKVDRNSSMKNHTATHLLQATLKQVLGSHIEQRGSLVNPDYLRFDFSHFEKIDDKKIAKIEQIINQKIMDNIPLNEQRNIPIKKAMEQGATALFGEKYGDSVRMITFDNDFSKELCGGTHVKATGEIGLFKIKNESAIAAGVRRIEAYTGSAAYAFVNQKIEILNGVKNKLNLKENNLLLGIDRLKSALKTANSELEIANADKLKNLKKELLNQIKLVGNTQVLIQKITVPNAASAKDLAFQLNKETENLLGIFAYNCDEKPGITVFIDKNIISRTSVNANMIIKELAPLIKGGGGGQPFLAQAGGKDANGINAVITKANETIEKWVD